MKQAIGMLLVVVGVVLSPMVTSSAQAQATYELLEKKPGQGDVLVGALVAPRLSLCADCTAGGAFSASAFGAYLNPTRKGFFNDTWLDLGVRWDSGAGLARTVGFRASAGKWWDLSQRVTLSLGPEVGMAYAGFAGDNATTFTIGAVGKFFYR
jgi:hypothetical protein